MNISYEKGSYRDPSGKIFYFNNKVYRGLNNDGVQRFKKVNDKGVIKDSIEKNFLIPTKIVEKKIFKNFNNDFELILEHEKVNFISYPYEWSFDQLKDAALHHLDFQIFLLEKNCILIDASAYNIQFINTKPIFIDILSIEEYRIGDYWYAHKQFCENFLNPLLLASKKNINFNEWFRGSIEGISTHNINAILNLKDKLSLGIFTHVYLLDKLEKKSIQDPNAVVDKLNKQKQFKKSTYKFILLNLRKLIHGLKKQNVKTTWQDYSINNTYLLEEENLKKQIISNFSKKNNFKLLADIGCNTGIYSFLSLESGSKNVIGFDYDINALNDAYIFAKNNNLNFQGIYLNATNPSPNQGWNEEERKNIKNRVNFDGVIALAFIHHLCIAKNIPIDQAINWLVSFAPKGIIEFIPKTDETIKKMLQIRKDIFKQYNEEKFEELLSLRANIISKNKLTLSGRVLYEYSCV